ncbi:hypothetical protein [Arthrobacter sp. zg-Y1110]|uniref:hypothetical protein n=1 Tax=Arthrobacter sp. zg-Y1110 TaxID=2886932 RepID=UPI001D15B913|nr:hypothetical protein [Arthrobacter sp. zg-Y1110]MCC3292588.1 hypothetical protein [Arthrobacter sp. zg-Y1110]UWX86979.1 hypothetical protein N2K99_16650 [Arthrobacter sp. zg-Y1110]
MSEHSKAPSTAETTEAARELLKSSGLSTAQIGRLTGTSARSVHSWASGTVLSPARAKRLMELHELVFSLDASSPAARLALMLDSSRGQSLFHRFHAATPRPQQIQFPIPVMERLGA